MEKRIKYLEVMLIILIVLCSSDQGVAMQAAITDKGMQYFNEGKYSEALSCFKQGAQAKDADAMFFLGHMYHEGLGVQKNDAESMKWFKLSADNGSIEAKSNVGRMYANGDGVKKAYKEAAKWFIYAAKQGNDIAMYNLGELCRCGYGVEKNYDEAIYWFKQAAAKGNVSAMTSLGLIYSEKELVESLSGKKLSGNESFNWYMKAAEKGDISAMFEVAKRYMHGDGVQRNENAAKMWLQKAKTAEVSKKQKEIHVLTNSANQGSAESLFKLGEKYQHGEGVAKNLSEAEKYYKKAIDMGHTGAMTQLAQMKEGTPEAANLYIKAAEAGNPEAMYLLGLLYLNGNGVVKNEKEAVRWFVQSAEKGDDTGMFFLAEMYETGIGIERNHEKALVWYKKAAELGNPYARSRLR